MADVNAYLNSGDNILYTSSSYTTKMTKTAVINAFNAGTLVVHVSSGSTESTFRPNSLMSNSKQATVSYNIIGSSDIDS